MNPRQRAGQTLGVVGLVMVSWAPLAIAQSRPVDPNDPSAVLCQEAVYDQVRRDFTLERLLWSTNTTTEYFISNAEVGIKGEGQFLQTDGWHTFTYDCTVNIRSGTVTQATYSLKTTTGETARPANPNDPMVQLCQADLAAKIRREYALDKLVWNTSTTTEYFISNAETGIRGQGQFLQSDGWHTFNYDCRMNIRNGTVVNASYTVVQ